jgi:PTH2 family peptidyl-tRNA hydrolase
MKVENMWEFKQVIVIPEDVEMSPGKLGVQVAHASITPILKNMDLLDDIKGWFDDGKQQKKVVLKIKNRTKLLNFRDKAIDEGYICELIRDAGRTEVEPGTITALGFFPMKSEEIDKITKKLSLFS